VRPSVRHRFSRSRLEEIERTRALTPKSEWTFGRERVRTKVYVMVPPEVDRVDVGLVKLRLARADHSDDVLAWLEGSLP
jgi:hypothetical protein